MAIEVNGKSVEINENGHLENSEDWSEELAKAIAAKEGLDLSDQHWDVIHYLREEYFNNTGNQPNNRVMAKVMQAKWPDEKVNASKLFDLFPGTPSKQAGRIAGLPESMRKGGY